jgi:hypothetical protein
MELYYPLPRIHTTTLSSAYFGIDNCECECQEYLFIYLFMSLQPLRAQSLSDMHQRMNVEIK